MNNMRNRCNQCLSSEIDIVVCTVKDHHLIPNIQKHLFSHRVFDCDPRFLGYECHTVLAERIEKYDYYCFIEDDLEVSDPLFFVKLRWFVQNVGDDSVLQPHRYEVLDDPPVRKLYIDGRLRDPTWSSRFQDPTDRRLIEGQALGTKLRFERTDNPHSGCFFLTAAQMKRWAERPYFLDRSDCFAGPLESAATLGLMRTFRVYKPVMENAGFLELQHLDRRYLGKQLRFSADFRLAGS